MPLLERQSALPRRAVVSGFLLLCLAAASVLRFWNLDLDSLWLDETFSANFVLTRSLPDVVADSFRVDYHPFLYYALLDIWTGAKGCSDWDFRALSALFGVAGVAAAFRCNFTGLLCCLLVALAPVHVRYSQEVRMYPLTALLWPLVLCAIIYCIRNGIRWLNGCLLVLILCAFWYSHGSNGPLTIPFLLTVSGIALTVLLRNGNRTQAIRLVVVIALSGLAFLPWALRLVTLTKEPKELLALDLSQCASFLYWLLLEDRSGGPVPWGPMALLCGITAIGVILAVFHYRSERRLYVWALAGSVAAVLLTQGLLDQIKPSYQQRNLLFLLIPLLAILSYATVWLARGIIGLCSRRAWRPTWALAALIPVTLLAVAMGARSVQNVSQGYGKEPWRAAVAEVAPHLQPGDTVVFYADYMERCWDYYYPVRACRPQSYAVPQVAHEELGIPRTDDKARFDAALAAVLAAAPEDSANHSTWVFYSHVDDGKQVHDWLLAHGFRSEWGISMAGLMVYQYTR